MSSNGNPDPVVSQVRIIELSGIPLQVGTAPLDSTKRAIFLGPLILQVSLGDEAVKAVVEALTGIAIAGVNEMPKL